MRRTTLLLMAAALLGTAAASHADTVVLVNGQSYDDVIAERTAQGVRVQLGFGQITIPADQVRSITKAPSAVAEYLRRRAELEARPKARAADWLELARWAKVHDNGSGARESALRAAELDPRLPGLDALLRPLGLVYDEGAGRWLPYEESMARRGLVPYEGEWMTPAERRERTDAAERRRQELAQEQASRRMADAAEAMQRTTQQLALQQQLDREAAAQAYAEGWNAPYATPLPYFPAPVLVVTVPGVFPSSHGHHGHEGAAPSAHGWERMQWRTPGSLLPPPGDPLVPPPAADRPSSRTSPHSGSGSR